MLVVVTTNKSLKCNKSTLVFIFLMSEYSTQKLCEAIVCSEFKRQTFLKNIAKNRHDNASNES